MGTFEIIPILSGEFPAFEKSAFTLLKDAGTKIKAPIPIWLLQNGKTNILIDTGIGDPNLVKKHHYPIIKEQELDQSLHTYGVTPEDIDIVIWSHLHWDHCQNAELFRNATFIVQRREIEYAVSPLPVHRRAYEVGIKGLKPSWLQVIDSIELVDGDTEIVEGVQVLLHPGHAPGLQSVLVKGKNKSYLIAGDNIPLKENWNNENPMESIPSGVHVDLKEYYETFRKIEMIEATVFPGHDYSIFEQPYYE